MCRTYGIFSLQCLNAYIQTAKCEGRFVSSHAVTTSTGAVRGTGLVRFLDEGAHGFRYAVADPGVKPPEHPGGTAVR